MHGEKVTLICEQCKEPFVVSKARAGTRGFRFCGIACTAAERAQRYAARRATYTCDGCGTSYQPKRKSKGVQHFCSAACQGKIRTGMARADVRPMLQKICVGCGIGYQSRAADRRYCSKPC